MLRKKAPTKAPDGSSQQIEDELKSLSPIDWSPNHVAHWAKTIDFPEYSDLFLKNKIDGGLLLYLSEQDIRHMGVTILGDVKHLRTKIAGLFEETVLFDEIDIHNTWRHGDRLAFFKLLFSIGYLILVAFVTAFTMVVVHDRVPTNIPPLPDIILDNISRVPEAFQVVELFILLMGLGLVTLLFFHRHRLIVARRFCTLAATVFLLRCLTMFVTSLSVPDPSLECTWKAGSHLDKKLFYAWQIIVNGGLSLNGVRTCGDYMFSGHTVMLTLLRYHIVEYTPRGWRGLEAVLIGMNLFGSLLVLLAHEHYSIDVIVAFFLSSRLHLYYHSVANSITSQNIGHQRSRQFFPFIEYFEEFTDGTVPNQFAWPWR